jgi:lysophospholipid acyltransferase (LPLAT)-like uncharacterized protein
MIKNALNRIVIFILPSLGSLLTRLVALTMKLGYVNFDGYRDIARSGQNVIIAFWHGRLLLMPYAYFGLKGITILVSQHRDGELVARAMKHFGIESVRGSSTRGWLGGVKGILKAARAGRDIAITPDGPKGPVQKAQMGVVQIARATGLTIIPMTFGASKKKPFPAGMPL